MHHSSSSIVNRRRCFSYALFFVLFAAIVGIFTLPLNKAFEIGGDEGYELMKALLVSQGIPLYDRIWNDQPPLHTALLAWLFNVFGPSAYCGRLLTIAFACILLIAFIGSVGDHEGCHTAIVAGLLLIASPFTLTLSTSTMLEVPAFSFGMISTLFIFFWAKTNHNGWLFFSGFVMGLALNTKLTAALLIPGLCFEIAATQRFYFRATQFFLLIKRLSLWTGFIMIPCILAILQYPGMSFEQLLGTHFASELREVAGDNAGMKFSIVQLWPLFYCLLPAGISVLLRGLDGDLVSIRLPLIWLATILIAHILNRPYWAFYLLHFSIPIAWLAAVGMKELFVRVINNFSKLRKDRPPIGWPAVLAVVFAVSFVEGGRRMADEYRAIIERKHVNDHKLVSVLRTYADESP